MPSLIRSIYPIHYSPSYKTSTDVYLVLHIRILNASISDNAGSLSVKWEVEYNILINSSRKPGTFSLVEILPGWSGFSVPLYNYSPKNTTYFFKTDGEWTWVDFKTWTYSYKSAVTLQWNPHSFPIDTFESPLICVWTREGIYPNIKLKTPKIAGYVITLETLGLKDPVEVCQSFTLPQKLSIGLPSRSPFCFKIIVQRDMNSIFLYFAYFFFIFFIIYYIAVLSNLLKMDIKKKISMFASLSISVIAFIWTMRQIAGSISYMELVLMMELFGWMVIEIVINTDWSPAKRYINRTKRCSLALFQRNLLKGSQAIRNR